jgi:hypothetical protein
MGGMSYIDIDVMGMKYLSGWFHRGNQTSIRVGLT